MKRLFLLFVLTGVVLVSWSQPWTKYLDVRKGEEANFFQLQEAFYKWEKAENIRTLLESRDEEEGEIENWVQFKRWEYIWQTRVNMQGYFMNPWEIYQAATMFRQTQKIIDNSGDWQLIGPVHLPKERAGQPNGLGRINGVAFDPQDTATFYVCTASGGFWRTRDYGQSWEYLSVSLPTLGTSDAIVDPQNPDVIYLATGDRDAYDAKGLGIWKTVDGGQSWQRVLDSTMTVNMMIMDPMDNQKIIAGATFGIYVTDDGGQSWVRTLADIRIKDLEFHPANPNIVYATGEGRLFKSVDGGQSWVEITDRLNLPVQATRNVIGVSPNRPDWIYVVATNDNGDYSSPFLGVYLSTDAGETFTQMSSSPNLLGYNSDGSDDGSQAWYDLAIAVDPRDAHVVYVGGVNIWKSLDSGRTWQINAHWTGSNAPAVHADQHDLRFDPDGRTLFSCNDGGIYYTKSGGNSWNNITSGLSITQVYRIGPSATNPLLFLNGYQDNGTALAEGIDKFSTVIGGDGMECLIDYSSDDYMFGELYFGDIRRSVSGSGFSPVTGDIDEKGSWVTPYVQNPHDPDKMIAGYINVWETDDVHASTMRWKKVTDFSDNSKIIALEYCTANPWIVYLSKSDGSFYRIDNLNLGQVTDLTSSLPGNYYITGIETDEKRDSVVYITAYDRDDSRGVVLKSEDRGQTWQDITKNLPAEYYNCIVLDTTSLRNQLYVGTFTGVYTINDSLGSWVDFSSGLPITDVRELEIFYGGGNPVQRHIKAATYGRGTWYSPLFVESTVDMAMDVPVNMQFCLGDSIPVYLVNLGLDTLHTAEISVFVNGQDIDTIQWSGNLATYEADTVYLKDLLNEPGNYDIKLELSVQDAGKNDENIANNSTHVSVDIVLRKPDYAVDFRDAVVPECWRLGDGWNVTKKDVGLQSHTAANGYLLLRDTLDNEAERSVVTCAFDFTGMDRVYLKFDQLLDIEDGVATVDYSFDRHEWTQLVGFSTDRGWRGAADVYLMDISDLAGKSKVFLRFNYKGKGSVLWAIDDIEITGGLEDGVTADPVLIYPNPVEDVVNISFRQQYGEAVIRVLDLRGSVLYEKRVKNPEFEAVGLAGLHTGVYIVECVLPEKIVVKRLVKQ